MALPGSGALSLDDIQTEFGGTNPIGLSEYYSAAAGVPASGEISIADFYGTSARVVIPIAVTNATNYVIYDNRGPTYVAGKSDVTLTISGNIGSTTTATAALRTGTFASGDTVTIVNNGSIRAFGGGGGPGGGNPIDAVPGSAGGHAIDLGFPTTVTNNNLIQGGGGGGGGGGVFQGVSPAPKGPGTPYSYGGGGGGGGSGVGLGGAGGVRSTGTGDPGATGGADTGGAGGGGASAAGDGGTGGARGVAGAAGGSSTFAGGAGGAAGKSFVPNGNTLSLTNNGSIFGATT
jgi:hypothetical protein